MGTQQFNERPFNGGTGGNPAPPVVDRALVAPNGPDPRAAVVRPNRPDPRAARVETP